MKKILITILLVAAILRFVGIYPGYNQFHPDEGVSYSTAAAMLKEKTFFPSEGYRVKLAYPYFVPLVNFVAFKYFFVPVSWAKYVVGNIGNILDGLVRFPMSQDETKRIFQLYILGNREINTIFWSRSLTAVFGLGNVLLIYFIGSRLSGKKAGLIAAFILTFDFRQVTNSHFGLPDIYNSFFLLLAILAALNLFSNPTRKSYYLAGISAGLAFNIKFQFFGLIPLVFAHLMTAFKTKGNKLLAIFNIDFITCGMFIPLLTLLINPFHLIHIEETLIQITDVALKYGVGTNQLNFFPIWYLYSVDVGIILLVISIVGIFFSLATNFKKSLIVLSVLIFQIFFFFYYSTGGFHVRNLIPMTPILALFAASLLSEAEKTLPKFAFFAVLLTAVFIPARNSIISDCYYSKPWNFNQLSDWLYKNPLEGPVASNPTDPPTGSPPLTRTPFVQGNAFSMAEHKINGAKYALINTDWVGNSFYWWMVYYPGTLSEKAQKPISKLRNSYYGLATEELLGYQIFAATKPWQAPEANLILVEFPVWPKTQMKKVYSKDGKAAFQKEPGRVIIESNRARGNHLYKIEAVLASNTSIAPGDRDGFIRFDFDGNSCVSQRLFGEKRTKVEFFCHALESARTLTVSLQVENQGSTIWVEDIRVFESETEVDPVPGKYPYIENRVEPELIYQNSQANL